MSNQTGLDKIKSFENKVKIHQTQIKKLQSEEDEQTKDQLIFSIERIKMKIEALTSLPKLLSKKLTTLIAEDKIEEAILYVQRDDAVLSAVEKEKLITKLGFIQNFEEALANAAREYKEIVLDEANKPENQKIFLSPDSKSPFKYLLRPIQDTAKLISYFTQEGIVIRKMEVIWPNEIEKGMVKHCEEILYEKFPREDYIGISHLSCASCTEAVPHEKHRGDSYIAFEGTTHFEALTQAYEQAQAEGDSTMFRSISYDPDLWAASPILAGETPQAQTIEPIA